MREGSAGSASFVSSMGISSSRTAILPRDPSAGAVRGRDPPRHLIYNEGPMPERIWSLNDLARFLRFEDPEVRYWAAERLARHHTKEATDLLAPYLFDDHDLTPEMVASHLGRHGGPAHFKVLARG